MNRKEIAKRYFDAFNADDAETLISCLDPDVELVGRDRTFVESKTCGR